MRAFEVPRASYFVTTGETPRVRRPRDVAAAVFGLVLLAVALLTIDRRPQWEVALVELIRASPAWITTLLEIGYVSSLLYLLGVLVTLLLRRPRPLQAVRDLVVVIGAALVVVVLTSFLVNGEWPYVLPEIDLENAEPRFPVTRVAIVTAGRSSGVAPPRGTCPCRSRR